MGCARLRLTLRPAQAQRCAMAAVDFSGVLKLCKKAIVADKDARYASAADYFGAAAEASRALELPADSLIHVFLDVHHATMLRMHTELPGVLPDTEMALKRRRISILDAAAPVLLRR